ncbi:MAG TPA: ANTAR domain-containing protein [Micromonosporaceae bacterium]
MTAARDGHGSAERLASLVDQLRAERDGLREAMRSRALIEQAKGVLMARHRLTADEAFDRLRQESHRSNVRLAQVAASVVAKASRAPSGASPRAPRRGEPPPRAERPAVGRVTRPAAVPPGTDDLGSHTRYLLAAGRLDAAGSYDEVVAALAEAPVAWPPPASVVVTLSDPDGALRLAASRGLPAEMASQWTRIPPQVEVPLTGAARGDAVWLADPIEVERQYPVVREMSPRVAACVSLPLTRGGTVLGVIGLTWLEPLGLDAGQRSYLIAVTDIVCRAVHRLRDGGGGPGPDPAPSWLAPVLDGALTATALLRPVRLAGVVSDFAFEQVNAAADALLAGPERLVGATLLTVMPKAGAQVLMPLCRDVLADGRPRQLDDVRAAGRHPDDVTTYLTVRAVRLGDRVLASWQQRSPAEAMHEDLLAAGRAARVAAFRWNLPTGELRGSANLRAVLGWRAGTPLTAASVSQAFDPARWPSLRRAALATLRTGRPLEITVPSARRRRLHVVGERLLDGSGRPVALRGCVQDLTHLGSLQPRPSRRLAAGQVAGDPAHRTGVAGLGSVASG